MKAILTFQRAAGLPAISAIVSSGNGIHVYWISDKALTPSEWKGYAEGLKALLLQHGIKCDAGLTTDIARILRVPGTFNHKTSPPKPVELFNMPLVMYDFATALTMLPKVVPQRAASSTPSHQLFADGANINSFKNGAAFKIEDAGLGAGIKKFSEHLLNAEPILKQCRFLSHALMTGGKDYDNPLWNLSVLCSTFMENGNAIAHAVSKGHAEYSRPDTQALYDRKLAERHDRGLGYPSCSAIQSNGCKSCASCPLLAKGKSPLNIRPSVTATVTNGSSPSGSSGQTNWTGPSGISFTNIPHRQWLYGFDLVRGEITVIASPGGAGKSSLAIGMAICVATNREVLGEKIRGGGNLTALVINGEDSTDEIRRRTNAFALAHGIVESDLKGFTAIGADDSWVQGISFLTTNEKGMSTLNQNGVDALQLGLDALHPDVIVLDPLVSFACGNMNDNAVMALVMRTLKHIAARYNCVLIVHHTRKGGDPGNVETISGAAAITNLARRAIMPAPLTDDDLKRFGTLPSERFQYFKLVDAKSNLAPRASDSPIYRLHSVELPNPEPPIYPSGDNVQAITRFVAPTQPASDPDELKIQLAIMEVVERGKQIDGQAYPYSPSAAGANNERAFLPDAMDAVAKATAPRQWLPCDLKAVTDAAIKKMKADGRLVTEVMKDLMANPGRFRKARGLKSVPI